MGRKTATSMTMSITVLTYHWSGKTSKRQQKCVNKANTRTSPQRVDSKGQYQQLHKYIAQDKKMVLTEERH